VSSPTKSHGSPSLILHNDQLTNPINHQVWQTCHIHLLQQQTIEKRFFQEDMTSAAADETKRGIILAKAAATQERQPP
jgi:Holliday junction resolvasome RuvABC endonuclease subunit